MIFYPHALDLNLLDWSSGNLLAVSLGGHVYLWDAGTGEINQLLEMDDEDAYVASVAWTKDGRCLAVGSSTGDVQVGDVVCLSQPENTWDLKSLPPSCVNALIFVLKWSLYDCMYEKLYIGLVS